MDIGLDFVRNLLWGTMSNMLEFRVRLSTLSSGVRMTCAVVPLSIMGGAGGPRMRHRELGQPCGVAHESAHDQTTGCEHSAGVRTCDKTCLWPDACYSGSMVSYTNKYTICSAELCDNVGKRL